MNCPSRTDNLTGREDWNQNPNEHEGATRQDFNGRANTRVLRRFLTEDEMNEIPIQESEADSGTKKSALSIGVERVLSSGFPSKKDTPPTPIDPAAAGFSHDEGSLAGAPDRDRGFLPFLRNTGRVLVRYSKFVGPGFMISVAYIDPGNYSTGVAAGASYEFRLLFVVLLANIIAIYLQSLCIKLGTVSGMNLAQMCRAHLPRWLNYFLYFMAEAAIIATDIAEVIGTAIAINLLIPQIPLVAGCAISIVDVLLILMFYRPSRSMRGLRLFEFFVVALVLGVVVCFCIQLSLIRDTPIGEVFRGYLPSGVIAESNALYQACGILGATVMPHSLYLGSGIIQPRLLEHDVKHGHVEAPLPQLENSSSSDNEKEELYRPSLSAIKSCLTYSITELSVSLFTFALFVNSAIVITAGASLYGVPDIGEASLFSIHELLSTSIGSIAGTVFALALLLSGISAGIVCTIAGQMVSEGALNWRLRPWLRRLVTRSISIIPSIVIAAAVGEDGLTATLNGSQVALSIALPFVSAPIIYFTARNKFMTVSVPSLDVDETSGANGGLDDNETPTTDGTTREQDNSVKMRNHWITTTFAVIIWLIVATLNIANIVLLGLGK